MIVIATLQHVAIRSVVSNVIVWEDSNTKESTRNLAEVKLISLLKDRAYWWGGEGSSSHLITCVFFVTKFRPIRHIQNTLYCFHFLQIDINECKIGNGRCDHICVNTYQSRVCECKDGYRLYKNGESCIGRSIC